MQATRRKVQQRQGMEFLLSNFQQDLNWQIASPALKFQIKGLFLKTFFPLDDKLYKTTYRPLTVQLAVVQFNGIKVSYQAAHCCENSEAFECYLFILCPCEVGSLTDVF